MNSDKYIVHCPHCGIVEATMSDNTDDSSDLPTEGESELEEEVVETSGGPKTRIRCPRCGMWLASDLVTLED